jgi:DNA-binding response OmpR family regulator
MKTHKQLKRVNRHQDPILRNFHIPSLRTTQRKKKVLIVEDNIDLIHVLGLALELQGLVIIRAIDGKQALKMAASKLPDLILLDLSLPDMDGLEIVRQIRRNPKTCSTPILVTTGRNFLNDKEECLRNGCNDYLSKPFTPKELVARIEKLLVINHLK